MIFLTHPLDVEYEMGSTVEFRRSFVARLKQSCDESQHIPLPGHGRQQFIVDRLKVTPEAVSKWFNGVSMPRPDKMIALADLLECDQAWLAYGLAPEMDRTARRVHARESDGAVQLVLGMILLAGGNCGRPASTDPRSEYVDFYATMRGSVYPMHVGLAREISKDHFEAIIPKEYRDVRSIAVVPAGNGKYHFLDMPLPLIEEHKMRKSGSFAVNFGRVEASKYMTGRATWPRIRTFGELA